VLWPSPLSAEARPLSLSDSAESSLSLGGFLKRADARRLRFRPVRTLLVPTDSDSVGL